MARRVFLVGTDTDCGKTTVACALLRAAAAAGVRALPFKPAASGPVDASGDPERLVAAAGIAGLDAAEICPLRYVSPVAPGLAGADGAARFVLRGGADPGAEDVSSRTGGGRSGGGLAELSAGTGERGGAVGAEMSARTDETPRARADTAGRGEPGGSDMLWRTGEEREPAELVRACERLVALEGRYGPALTIIEGAGGLWVPMPGGSWLPAWIEAFAAEVVVVGRLGLGTINHCLLTFAGLAQLGVRARGFVLAQTRPGTEPAHAHNEGVIAAASGLPCLGVLGFAPDPDEHGWLRGGIGALLG